MNDGTAALGCAEMFSEIGRRTVPEISEKRSFWHAALTVGTAALIAATFILYLVRSQLKEWPTLLLLVPIVVAIPALLMLPLVHRGYQRGERPQRTPRQHLISAVCYGSAGIAGSVAIIADPKAGWRYIASWIYAGCWLLIAGYELYLANKKQRGLGND